MKPPSRRLAGAIPSTEAATAVRAVLTGERIDDTAAEQQSTNEPKRRANLRADVMPTQGYVLTVDGKLKARYETEQQAIEEASKLKQRFPVIQVTATMRRNGSTPP